MRISRFLGLAPVLLCIAAAPANAPAQALAQASTNAVQAAPEVPVRVEEPKICKQLPTSYTRLPNRACLTKKQWDQLNKELEDDR